MYQSLDHLPTRVLYLGGGEDVRILRTAPKTSKLPPPDQEQHNSKVLKTETQEWCSDQVPDLIIDFKLSLLHGMELNRI